MLVIILVTTLVDVVFHVTGVFPPMDQPINDALAALAIPQCWVGGKIFEMQSRGRHETGQPHHQGGSLE